MKQGELKSIFNKKKKFGENRFYNLTYLKRIKEEEPKAFLFTDDQLNDASARAFKNQEDLETCSFSKNEELNRFTSNIGMFVLGFILGLVVYSILYYGK